MPRRPRRIDAQKNRQKLLQAAREVLAERGFEAEIGEIATRAGIGTGTVYRNYGTKESLILEITRELVKKSSVELLEVTEEVGDAREAVRRTMAIGFDRVKEYGRLAIQLVAGAAPPPYSSAMDPQELAQIFRLLIRRGIEQGHFRRDLDVDFATAAWFALVSPLAFQLLGDRSPGEVVHLVTEFYLAGLGCAGASSPGASS